MQLVCQKKVTGCLAAAAAAAAAAGFNIVFFGENVTMLTAALFFRNVSLSLYDYYYYYAML